MSRTTSWRWLMLLAVALSLELTRPALAYIDPGPGSYLVQFLVAGAVGLALWFKAIWRRFAGLFLRGKKAPAPTEASAPAEPGAES